MSSARSLALGLVGFLSLAAACGAEPEVEDVAVAGSEITVKHHTEWTIDRGAAATSRVVAFGDSIFAGYQGSLPNVAKRAAPLVAAEYFARDWDANVQVIRRTRSGGIAAQVFSVMQEDVALVRAPSTRAVYFAMCGNDFLKARKRFDRSGRCQLTEIDEALSACTRYMESAMRLVVDATAPDVHKAIANLYYPGYDADDRASRCTNAAGQRVNVREELFPYFLRSNWRACSLAGRFGFACVDTFAEFMAADYDANGDGVVDVDGLRFDPTESEDAYVERLFVRLRSTIRDANQHALDADSTVDYILSDDTHPTFFGDTIRRGSIGRGLPDFSDEQLGAGQNPMWSRYGHERLGWAIYRTRPAPRD